jgi:hypothetical protein
LRNLWLIVRKIVEISQALNSDIRTARRLGFVTLDVVLVVRDIYCRVLKKRSLAKVRESRHLFPLREIGSGLNEVDVTFQIARKAIAGCPNKMLIGILVFPDVIFLSHQIEGLGARRRGRKKNLTVLSIFSAKLTGTSTMTQSLADERLKPSSPKP